MIIDTSAIATILLDETDAPAFATAIEVAVRPRMSAGTYLEAGIVLDGRRNPALSRRLDEFLAEASVVIEPVTERQAQLAREAYRDFGKGSGHPARLNFGDCLACALAKDKAEPLLFKGRNFAQTDVRRAI